MKQTFTKIASFAVAFAMVFGVNLLTAEAAALTTLSNNMSRQKVGENSSHDIDFTIPNAISAGGTILITFPTFDFSSVVTGDVTATGSPTVTLGGTNNTEVTLSYASGQAAGAINVTIADTNALNPSASGNEVITVEVDTDNDSTVDDSGEITVPILEDDQIVVKAKVDQVLFFDVRDATGGDDDNMVDFGTLTAGTLRYATDAAGGTGTPTASAELEAGTNASSGYTIAVEGSTLTSGSDTIDAIASATTTPSTAAEQFGFTVATGAGSDHGTIDANYAGGNYFLDDGNVDEVVSRTTPAAQSTYDITYVANALTSTPAGNYETALTYTMTANF
ncbi:hypothetical protein CL684_02195 [Candidatus Campbellbacteria bacterium]|nr:hypothetical protein [Candidatus Campbellbacteria bacterium]|tara:strand:+ start:759 stop:1763 length:1005 start_codon:yes stop_codon:yes gene_type:complete